MLFEQNQTFYAPAKLNLFLHITGKRTDGYHNLQTIFQLIDYYDEISFSPRDDQQISALYQIQNINPDNDLILKSAILLKNYAQKRNLLDNSQAYGLDIALKKLIPMGGGLGGGSSDAATTLLSLNKLWSLDLSKQELISIAAKIGADVPIFIYGKNAWAEGIGEKLTDIVLPKRWFFVLTPSVHISTKLLFQSDKLNRNCELLTIDNYTKSETTNVFEKIVLNEYPEVKCAYDWLSQFAKVRMTGTGACVFSEFDSEQSCLEIKNKLPENLKGFYAQSL
ncbi:MAG: 4-(cytidine 5'-diphospho)-2-C-methyl-D-erythritol kinase [Gammaproteobacteria bacterium]|nr:4-(cytidine 5'-diphospho)-2-C-methyl-D-erythritol kinase [Gammaproteobacteria bacterium]